MLFTDPQNGVLKSTAANWNSIVVAGGGGGGGVSSITNNDNNLLITPSTGAVVANLEQDVSIKNSLVVGNSNATGEFIFDTNGNLTLPLNSNTNGTTYIRAGDNTGTSTNAIDMFCNWDSTTGVYGGELFLNNSQAYIGIDGVSNSVTNYISVDNTSSPSSGTINMQVSNPTNRDSASIAFNTNNMELVIPGCTVTMDNTTNAGIGTFSINSSNTTRGDTMSLVFKNDTDVGGLLYCNDITANNFNINGQWNLPNTKGSIGTLLQSNGDGTASWVAPASVGASYCCIYSIPGQNSGTNPNYPLILNTGTAAKTSDYTINANSITLQPNSIYKVDYSFSFVQFAALTCLCQIVAAPAQTGITISGTQCQINTSGQPMSGTGIITTGSQADPLIQLIFSATASVNTYAVNSIAITKV